MKHVKDIAKKYIIPGETSDSALMFSQPRQSMLNSIRHCPKLSRNLIGYIYCLSDDIDGDAKYNSSGFERRAMREQASLIQKEAMAMNDDVVRLINVLKAQSHCQAEEDIRQIRISTESSKTRHTSGRSRVRGPRHPTGT